MSDFILNLMCTLLLLLFGLSYFTATAQISPGPLSSAHANLDGPTKCGSCHTFGLGKSKFKCLDCHSEISRRIRDKRGLHARVVKAPSDRQACIQCHTEHYGQNFYIVRWETTAAEFDHSKSGYPLAGKHAGLECARCHNPGHIPGSERQSIKVRDLTRTYLGLSPACLTCHQDVHRGQLGVDCARCHQGFHAWKPAAGFDHGLSRFPLTGRHSAVACAKCHTAGQSAQYRGLSFASCGDCHKDPHRGAFRASCDSCHDTTAWGQVRLTTSSFNHATTVFPLKGLHGKLACSDCHRSSNFAAPIVHNRCADCHRDDPHRGQFASQDCGQCHNEQGFKPALFTLTSHQNTAYPLLGKHAMTACDKCHIPAGRNTIYKVKHAACLDCHRDAHAGQFAGAGYGNRCESCHAVDGFQPSTFRLASHAKTRFQLSGGHLAIACAECHRPPVDRTNGAAQYRFTILRCDTCHPDVHKGEAISNSRTCESCHNSRGWRELAAFDHSTTQFALSGAHRAVACIGCHHPENTGEFRRVGFRGAPVSCGGCHQDPHAGQFVVQCNSCHSSVTWKPSAFDHETQSRFSLAGAHRAVACSQCHATKSEINGRMAVVYRNTPVSCSACHSGK